MSVQEAAQPRVGRPAVARMAAVVLNYRTPELTQAAVQSLDAELDPARDAIVVVDNHSGDGSWEPLRTALEAAPRRVPVRIIEAGRNGGFAYGNNLGIAAVEAQAYLLLNSDAQVRPGAAAALWDVLERHPAVGLAGPSVLAEDGTLLPAAIHDRTPWNELLRAARSRLLSRILGPLGVKDVVTAPAGPARVVERLSFVCVLLRGAMVRAIGPLDEGYFMYMEDNDYCRRARARGWLSWYCPSARVVHLDRGWSRPSPGRLPAYFYESRARYFRTYYGSSGLLVANLFWTIGWIGSRVGEGLTGRRRPAPARATRDIWRRSCRRSSQRM